VARGLGHLGWPVLEYCAIFALPSLPGLPWAHSAPCSPMIFGARSPCLWTRRGSSTSQRSCSTLRFAATYCTTRPRLRSRSRHDFSHRPVDSATSGSAAQPQTPISRRRSGPGSRSPSHALLCSCRSSALSSSRCVCDGRIQFDATRRLTIRVSSNLRLFDSPCLGDDRGRRAPVVRRPIGCSFPSSVAAGRRIHHLAPLEIPPSSSCSDTCDLWQFSLLPMTTNERATDVC